MTISWKRTKLIQDEWLIPIVGEPYTIPHYPWMGILKVKRPKILEYELPVTQCLVLSEELEVLTLANLNMDNLMIIFQEIYYLAYMKARVNSNVPNIKILEVLLEDKYPQW